MITSLRMSEADLISITIKTLDGNSKLFDVSSDLTVKEFKQKIAEPTGIASDVQRLIYAGRVLQDSSKLTEYDVAGKVVHLVERPPQSRTGQSPSARRTTTNTSHSHPGSAQSVVLNSIQIAGPIMQSIISNLGNASSSHINAGRRNVGSNNEAYGRMSQVKKMIRSANITLDRLSDPGTTPNRESQPDPTISAENAVSIMRELSEQISSVFTRVQPYLFQFSERIGGGEVVSAENSILLLVPEVLHHYSHALHAFSDIIVEVSPEGVTSFKAFPTPRIQQQAFHQTVPIQIHRPSPTQPSSTPDSTTASPNVNVTTTTTSNAASSTATTFTVNSQSMSTPNGGHAAVIGPILGSFNVDVSRADGTPVTSGNLSDLPADVQNIVRQFTQGRVPTATSTASSQANVPSNPSVRTTASGIYHNSGARPRSNIPVNLVDRCLPCSSHHFTARPIEVTTPPQSRSSNQPDQGINVEDLATQLVNAGDRLFQGTGNVLQANHLPDISQMVTNTLGSLLSHGSSSANAESANSNSPNVIGNLLVSLSSHLEGLSTGSQGEQSLHEFVRQMNLNQDHEDGDGFLHNLTTLVLQKLTVLDLIKLVYGDHAPLIKIRGPLREFFTQNLLENKEFSESNLQEVCESVTFEYNSEWERVLSSAVTKENIDLKLTNTRFLQVSLLHLAKMTFDDSFSDVQFAERLNQWQMCRLTEWLILHRSILQGGQQDLDGMVGSIIDSLGTGSVGENNAFVMWMNTIISQQTTSLMANTDISEEDVRHYVVMTPTAAPRIPEQQVNDGEESDDDLYEDAMDSGTLVRTSRGLAVNVADVEIPAAWENVMARDSTRQSSCQAPFSDAYLAGMPTKRRKVVKPEQLPFDAKSTVASIVAKAVKESGATLVNGSLLDVTHAVANNSEVVDDCSRQLRSSVKRRATNDANFSPVKHPNTQEIIENPTDGRTSTD